MRNSFYLFFINTVSLFFCLFCHTSFRLADMTVLTDGLHIAPLFVTVSLYAQLASKLQC